MKNLKIFGDSIIKGVTYNGQSYHLCQEHDFDTLRAQGVTVENNAKMGATIDAGLKQLDRKLGTCDGDTTVLFCLRLEGHLGGSGRRASAAHAVGEVHRPILHRHPQGAERGRPRGHDEPAAAGAGAVFLLYHQRAERGKYSALAG